MRPRFRLRRTVALVLTGALAHVPASVHALDARGAVRGSERPAEEAPPRHTAPVALRLASTLGDALAAPTLLAQAPAPASLSPAPAAADAATPRLVPLEVSVNGSPGGQWLLVELAGTLYAPEDAFTEWRLQRSPNTPPLRFRQQDWYPLTQIPGFQWRLNPATQSVDLVFSPTAFAATKVTQRADEGLVLTPALTSAFINYDLSLTQAWGNNGTSATDLGVLSEAGLSGDFGILTSSQVGRWVSDALGRRQTVTRLETTYTRDFLDRDLTLRLGDSITRPGLFGTGTYFGGIQVTRNFGLRPGFFTQPLPLIAGTANAASTVELYINDALRQTASVPSGPFTISSLPSVSGSGEARLVVRDILGRETVITQPFLTNTALLDAGLTDWSLEVGTPRVNLGTANADYGPLFAAGLLRHGLTRRTTLEASGQVSRSLQRAGLGVSQNLFERALVQAGASMSRSNGSSGIKWVLGLERDSITHGFGVRLEHIARGYQEIGWAAPASATRRTLGANYSYALAAGSSLSATLAQTQFGANAATRSIGLGYSQRVGSRATLALTFTRLDGVLQANAIGATLVVPLDANVITTASYTDRDGTREAYVSASRSPTDTRSAGWRVLAGTRPGDTYAEAGYYAQTAGGNRALDIAASRTNRTVRASTDGSMLLADGKLITGRRIDGSFALVEVPGFAGIGVGTSGNRTTQTDSRGIALLPGLAPLQANTIQLVASDLPVSAEIDNIEATITPANRVGVKVSFAVRGGRAALVRILLADGEAAPIGAEVRLDGRDEPFIVARRGEVFVTGIEAQRRLTLSWNNQRCVLNFELPAASDEDIARIGPLTCAGVQR